MHIMHIRHKIHEISIYDRYMTLCDLKCRPEAKEHLGAPNRPFFQTILNISEQHMMSD